MTESTYPVKPYPLGAFYENGRLRFAFASTSSSCGVILYDRETGKQLQREAFTPEERIGNIYCKYIRHADAGKISYLFYEDDRLVPDPFARAFAGRHTFGKRRDYEDLKAIIPDGGYDWRGDKRPSLKLQDSICYSLHVRGFTAHASSQVSGKGTFSGIAEKIPYLKEMGITTLELQPAYEFTELPAKEENEHFRLPGAPAYLPVQENPQDGQNRKLNYWGYKQGFYYAPKQAYSAAEDAVFELKELVRRLHENGMELVMQFYFPETVKFMDFSSLFRYWVLEYHIDGFHLMGANLPAERIAADPMLADTKLWYDSFDADAVYGRNESPASRNLAVCSDDYLYTVRRLLKGDEGVLESALYQMRYLPQKLGRIHYLTRYQGFTLMDLVSYDYKHNEANGEENRDGTDANCSWNCGEEGTTRKSKIKTLRIRQIKNAMCLLIFSQSTPMIFMGDEFGNSQKGNNNPYCQDNPVTWLDWNCLKKNSELAEFWKMLTGLRREHPILTPGEQLRLMDYIACGYPDLSYHGKSAWRLQAEYHSRQAGVMFCGRYARKSRDVEDDFLYLAMNMHWEKHELALPRLPKGMKWKLLLTTDGRPQITAPESEEAQGAGNMCLLEARSIAVFISEAEQETAVKKRTKTVPDDRTCF